MSPLVLVVEYESSLATLLRYILEREGCRVALAKDGKEAQLLAREHEPNLILLDQMLPSLPGIDACWQLRRMSEARGIPTLILIAADEADSWAGRLEGEAASYVKKPFRPSALIELIRSMLPRSTAATNGETLQFEDLTMDVGEHRVRRGGREIRLNPSEFRLLRHLMEHHGRVFSREQIAGVVRRRDRAVDVQIVDVYIRRLRRALDIGNGIDLIRTVRSGGYALDRPSPSDRTYGKRAMIQKPSAGSGVTKTTSKRHGTVPQDC